MPFLRLKMRSLPWLGLIYQPSLALSLAVSNPQGQLLPTTNRTSEVLPSEGPFHSISNLPLFSLGIPQYGTTINKSKENDVLYRCSSESYGRPPAAGCLDAYEKLPESSDIVVFGDRRFGSNWNIPLPFRLISGKQPT